MDVWKDVVVPMFVAAIGTVAGASVAFWIERRKRQREVEDRNVTATNTALYALFRAVNELVTYRQQAITPYVDDPDRWHLIPPMLMMEQASFDTSALSYLFEMPGDAPSLPMAVQTGLDSYKQAAAVARMRHDLHLHIFQPAAERGSRLGAIPGIKDRVDTVLGGPRVTESLRSCTDQLIGHISHALDDIPKYGEWLRSVAKQKYPKRQIIRLDKGRIEERMSQAQ